MYSLLSKYVWWPNKLGSCKHVYCSYPIFVEGHHGMLFTTNCLLLIGKSLSQVFGLVHQCLRQVRVGIVAGA